MKRILTLVAVLAATLLSASRAHAQFGIVGGLTSSKTSFESAVSDVKNISLYHAGVTYNPAKDSPPLLKNMDGSSKCGLPFFFC